MKTCEEITGELLRRRDEYDAKKIRTRRKAVLASVPALCIVTAASAAAARFASYAPAATDVTTVAAGKTGAARDSALNGDQPIENNCPMQPPDIYYSEICPGIDEASEMFGHKLVKCECEDFLRFALETESKYNDKGELEYFRIIGARYDFRSCSVTIHSDGECEIPSYCERKEYGGAVFYVPPGLYSSTYSSAVIYYCPDREDGLWYEAYVNGISGDNCGEFLDLILSLEVK